MKKLLIVLAVLFICVTGSNAGQSFLKVSFYDDIQNDTEMIDVSDNGDQYASGTYEYDGYYFNWHHIEGRIGVRVWGTKLLKIFANGNYHTSPDDGIHFGFTGLNGEFLNYSVSVQAPGSSFSVQRSYWKTLQDGGTEKLEGDTIPIGYSDDYHISESYSQTQAYEFNEIHYGIKWGAGFYDMNIMVLFDSPVSNSDTSWGAVKTLYR